MKIKNILELCFFIFALISIWFFAIDEFVSISKEGAINFYESLAYFTLLIAITLFAVICEIPIGRDSRRLNKK